jgi:hypothetical protein
MTKNLVFTFSILYYELQLLLIHHVDYTPFICDKGHLFGSKFLKQF